MVPILLTILKGIGIILLVIFIVLAVLLLLVLFVPVRYRVDGCRTAADDVPVRITLKVSWLLHLLRARYQYPGNPVLQVYLLCFPLFPSREKKNAGNTAESTTKEDIPENTSKAAAKVSGANPADRAEESADKENDKGEACVSGESVSSQEKQANEEDEQPTLLKFFHKLFRLLQNIRYTITRIYDKIKHVIRNIRYYFAVIQSERFKRAFGLCRTEIFSLLKGILPGKISGNFIIGTGDPAGTAQILAVHGLLYPLIGNHITITPDFENSVIEGDFLVKGRITAAKILKTAIKIYFNKDVKQVIRLLKREAAINGRK